MQRHISIVAVMLLVALVITATAGAIGCTSGLEPTAIPTLQPTSTSEPVSTRTAPTSINTAVTEPTAIPTPQPTSTSEPVSTRTAPTNTPTQEPAYTSTPEPTLTNTPKPTDTATPAPTSISTFEPTNTLTPLPTDTVPTDTAMPEPTSTYTAVPSDTPTTEPTSTHTAVPTVTPTPVTGPCANGVVVSDPQNNLGLVSDCEALLAMRDEFASDAELNWSTELHIEAWNGVTVEGIPPRVAILELVHYYLNGHISSEIGNLTALTELLFDDNQLTGEIPAELGNLVNLKELRIYRNDGLIGEIPATLDNLINLEILALAENNLMGNIPTEIGSLTNLKVVWLNANQLTGEVPAELGNLASLEFLGLGSNQIVGEIPTELGKLTNLQGINVIENQLTGKIPYQLSNLTKLIYLRLNNNRLTGEIPGELGKLSELRTLALYDNQLTGMISPELGNLGKLEGLLLERNMLIGEIPNELGNLSKLQTLTLHDNRLTGEIPIELGVLTDLQHFDLSDNRLTGEIPVELGRLRNLKFYSVANNELQGCIPDALGLITEYYIDGLRFCSAPPLIKADRPVFDGGIDLGVTHIERLPRFRIYELSYFGGGDCAYPLDENVGVVACPGEKDIKRWPDPDETVELIAHVWNFGDVESGTFGYEWKIDGRTIVKDRHEGVESGEQAEIKISMQWPDAQSNPVITFTVDPDDEIQELIEDNNSVDDWIKGYTLGISFSPTAYESLRLSNEEGRTIQSPERWIHDNVEFLNQLFIEADLKDRIRVDMLYITDKEWHIPQSLRFYMDGWWRIWHGEGSFYSPKGYERRPEIDLGLLHEWMHQLGVIDLYWMNIDTSEVLLPDANRPGQKAACGEGYYERDEWEDACHLLPDELQDIMSGTDYVRIGPHTAGGLRSTYGHRRGHYGEYLYDTPDTTIVKILDKRGNPVPDATLRFYQRKWLGEDGPQIEEGSLPIYETYFIGTVPEFEVTTDENGLAVLPNRGETGPVTATGHQLRPNPFGIINVVGGNGIFLIEMESSECTNYEWLTILEVNLAYWDGQIDEAVFTKTLRCPPP